MLAARYPYYHDTIRQREEENTGPLARALSAARRALKGLSVIIDARILSGPMTGVQLHVLELIGALARTGQLRLTVVVPGALSSYGWRALEQLPDVRLITRSEAESSESCADLVHRPFQVNTYEDLSFLAPLGERLVVTHHDLISYQNPSYFTSFDAWEGYRRVTRSALAVADGVVFVSTHARDDALAEDLIEPHRANVVYNGVDHSLLHESPDPMPPRSAAHIREGSEAILCIGTDFRHKNRVFALRVLEQLQLRHDWRGSLLLVGPPVAEGSSRPDEAEMLTFRPRLADSVVDFASVTEAEKAWLFARAGVVLYPTVHEGFGLIPFEAADHGVPCMWARGTSLSEILPDGAAEIVSWDAEYSADRALTLLRDGDLRDRNLAAIRSAAARLTWDATAQRLVELYRATCDAPATPTGSVQRRQGLMQGALSKDAMRLIGPGGALPQDVERPLLALATHPQIGAPMFRAMKLGYRAFFNMRRLRRGDGDVALGEVRREARRG
jgi:glycosyltransferase involved in cell wall biosynthesis